MVDNNLLYINHMLDAIGHIESFLKELDGNEQVFASSRHWQDAFVKELEIIGEAANHLDSSFTKKHAQIKWKKVIAMRHKLIHDYTEINMSLVWLTATQDIPKLKDELGTLQGRTLPAQASL